MLIVATAKLLASLPSLQAVPRDVCWRHQAFRGISTPKCAQRSSSAHTAGAACCTAGVPEEIHEHRTEQWLPALVMTVPQAGSTLQCPGFMRSLHAIAALLGRMRQSRLAKLGSATPSPSVCCTASMWQLRPGTYLSPLAPHQPQPVTGRQLSCTAANKETTKCWRDLPHLWALPPHLLLALCAQPPPCQAVPWPVLPSWCRMQERHCQLCQQPGQQSGCQCCPQSGLWCHCQHRPPQSGRRWPHRWSSCPCWSSTVQSLGTNRQKRCRSLLRRRTSAHVQQPQPQCSRRCC